MKKAFISKKYDELVSKKIRTDREILEKDNSKKSKEDRYTYIHLEKDWGVGLGTTICFLSVLWETKFRKSLDKIYLIINGENDFVPTFQFFIELYNLDFIYIISYPAGEQEKMLELYGSSRPFSDFAHIFGSYLKPTTPIYRTYRAKYPPNYKFIGISITAFMDEIYSEKDTRIDKTAYPHCKYQPIEYFARLITHLKMMGWDIINIDNRDIIIEDKVDLLINHCQAVIGYEGGIAHLCHTLGIPYIMTPWNKEASHPLFCDIMHPTLNCWFLRDAEEIFAWDKKVFNTIIKDLYRGRGNNYLARDIRLQYSTSKGVLTPVLHKKSQLPDLPEGSVPFKWHSKEEREYLNDLYGFENDKDYILENVMPDVNSDIINTIVRT